MKSKHNKEYKQLQFHETIDNNKQKKRNQNKQKKQKRKKMKKWAKRQCELDTIIQDFIYKEDLTKENQHL